MHIVYGVFQTGATKTDCQIKAVFKIFDESTTWFGICNMFVRRKISSIFNEIL